VNQGNACAEAQLRVAELQGAQAAAVDLTIYLFVYLYAYICISVFISIYLSIYISS